ncbi:relaxase/mobilization nuclease domain-containing protein [Larkinella bovis]|uniref:Relaxase/mobilization nuclease domain-containing protein n=1 Tax=Larkinella bovis TaxID=683041 RepID=A0ABW0ID44_9BACT
MVIRGNIRGNGKQLAQYLVSGEANERVQILDVAGRRQATDAYLHQTLQSMSLTSELTRTSKGLYHAQINPAYREDRSMSDQDWMKAADILGQELGLQEQRRIIVLHQKKGRTHAHVVWERYDHQTGTVISNRFSRLAQDRARKEMERVFEHQQTPHRNKHRPELKETLTNLWHEAETGQDFIRAVHANGYLLAEGVPRHPFMVVDENGRSFDLVRQLKGIRIKEVRARLRNEKLMPEKEAIEIMRQKQDGSSDSSKAEQQRDTDQDKALRTASVFWTNKLETTVESPEVESQKKMKKLADAFIQSGQEMTEKAELENSPEKKKNLAEAYMLNSDELTEQNKKVIADAERQNQFDNDIASKQYIHTKPERNDSKKRRLKFAAQFMANEKELIQPGEEPINKLHQETLRNFIKSEEGMFTQSVLTDEKERHQTVAQQFFDNQELAAELTDEEKLMQKMVLEQKEIRERSRQKKRRRSW